jgi:hypothetical protein
MKRSCHSGRARESVAGTVAASSCECLHRRLARRLITMSLEAIRVAATGRRPIHGIPWGAAATLKIRATSALSRIMYASFFHGRMNGLRRRAWGAGLTLRVQPTAYTLGLSFLTYLQPCFSLARHVSAYGVLRHAMCPRIGCRASVPRRCGCQNGIDQASWAPRPTLVEDLDHPGDWRVEYFDSDGAY